MSGMEGLFCDYEGYCVCGHDCLAEAKKPTMLDVLTGHYIDIAVTNPDNAGRCVCGYSADPMNISWDEHLAEALSAAGFGPVKEAAAKALEDAADEASYGAAWVDELDNA